MIPIEPDDIIELKKRIDEATPLAAALASTVGRKTAAGVFWRFFAYDWPIGGYARWNDAPTWKYAWGDAIAPSLHCFAEDAFGNQLVTIAGESNAMLWTHESGQLFDLYLEPVELLGSILLHSIDWIDFYQDSSIDAARRFGLPSQAFHLHWVRPLVLGGTASLDKLELVERAAHLIGHGDLWRNIGDVAPGTWIR